MAFCLGGNDTMDTIHRVVEYASQTGYEMIGVGVSKTVDNDLPVTDNCPGFGSVAKYVAISTKEAALDVLSMAETSTKVFILEVMGRHAGWIAAATPMTASRLNMFEPTMLPIASPYSPRITLTSETASSGRLVASATSVAPSPTTARASCTTTKSSSASRARSSDRESVSA